MATRFYLPASGTAPLGSLAVDANWERSDNLSRLPCDTIKSNTSLTQMSATWPITSTGQWVWRQFQSKRLAAGYSWTTSDTISMVIKVAEAIPQCDSHIAYSIRVVSADGTVVRGTIGLYHATSTEYPTSLATIATRIHDANTNGASNFSSQAGDRIIIEIGHHGVTPAADVVYHNYGDPSATSDYALTSGLTTDLCPWVELSRTVDFNLRSNKSAYMKGQTTASSNTDVYLEGANPSTPASDNTPAYTTGQTDTLDNQPGYLTGQTTILDNQPAYASGSLNVSDHRNSYVAGSTSDLDNAFAFLQGSDNDLSGKTAYLQGVSAGTDTSASQDAYLAGSQDGLSNKTAYLIGRGIPLMPDSTIGQSGSWKRENEETTNLHLSLDEFPVSSDTDYVHYDNVLVDEYFEVGLENPSGTPGTGDVIIHWRGFDENITGTCEMTIELREGGTVIASTVQTLPGSFTDYTYTLSAGEKASITDWTNLRFRVKITAV